MVILWFSFQIIFEPSTGGRQFRATTATRVGFGLSQCKLGVWTLSGQCAPEGLLCAYHLLNHCIRWVTKYFQQPEFCTDSFDLPWSRSLVESKAKLVKKEKQRMKPSRNGRFFNLICRVGRLIQGPAAPSLARLFALLVKSCKHDVSHVASSSFARISWRSGNHIMYSLCFDHMHYQDFTRNFTRR